jgi:putative ABC transport system ATP-binding protein
MATILSRDAAPPAGRGPRTGPAARLVRAVKAYDGGDRRVLALDDVSVDFAAGRFTAIMGPSGSGKSTLLHTVAGLDPLTGGAAFIGDVDLTTLSDRALTELRRDRVGFVFQAFNLIPSLSALDNITLPLALARRTVDRSTLDAVVDLLQLGARLGHRPSELSGGQQQRVAIARALVGGPEILFADEPTGNLDSRTGVEILGCLRAAVDDHGRSVVMVTHDPGAAAFADRVVFIVDGRVHDELDAPDADEVLAVMRTLGR